MFNSRLIQKIALTLIFICVIGFSNQNAFAQTTTSVSTQFSNLTDHSALLQGTVQGDHISTQWTQVCGPTTASIATANTWWTQVDSLSAGVYQFKLAALGNNSQELASQVLTVPVGSAFANATACATPTPITTGTQNTDVSVSTQLYGGSIASTANSALLQGSVTGAHISTLWTQVCGPSNATIQSPITWWTWVENLAAGVYKFKLTARGNANTDLASSIVNVTVGTSNANSTECGTGIGVTTDTVAPVITNITSTADNGTYVSRDTLDIVVSFSEPVIVTGTPTLLLETGDIDSSALYISGSNTANIVFRYTVVQTDKSSDLNYASVAAFISNGAIITDLAGNTAALGLPATNSPASLSSNKDLIINPPEVREPEYPPAYVTKVTSRKANGTYSSGEIIINVHFNKRLSVTGIPLLKLEIGINDALATYSSGSGSKVLKFKYTIQTGHNTSDLDYTDAYALTLNAGRIVSNGNVDVNRLLPTPGSAGSLSQGKDIVINTVDNDTSGICRTNCPVVGTLSLIRLTSNMLINEYANGDETLLVDEQEKFSLTTNGALQSNFDSSARCNYRSSTNDFDCFNPNVTIRQKAIDPNKDAKGAIIIDLGAPVALRSINFYDAEGQGPVSTSKEGILPAVEIYTGGPLEFNTLVGSTNLHNTQSITSVNTNATSRYLRLVFRGSAMAREIAIVGTYQSKPLPPISFTNTTKKSAKTFDQIVGVNLAFGMGISHNPNNPNNFTYYDDEFASNRHYTSFHWRFDASNNIIPPQPEITVGSMNRIRAKGGSFFNTMTGAAWSMVNPSTMGDPNAHFFRFQKAIPYTLCSATDTKQSEGGTFPYCNNSDIAQQPSSYALRGYLAGTAAANDKANGLIEIELGNEADGFWHETGYYKPFELATMTSVDYDGHCDTVKYNGQSIGVKNMASGMRVIMPALSFPDATYLKAMLYWYQHARGSVAGCQAVPVDATNVHYYANNTPGLLAGPEESTHGVSPEEWNLEEKIGKPMAVHNAFSPHNDFLVTEFGYDTCARGSQERVPQLGTFTRYQVHGMWLVRTMLLLSKIGVDGSNIFWLADQNKKSDGYCSLFTESGLLELQKAWNETGSNKPLYRPKDSWYYVVGAKNILTGYSYSAFEKIQTAANQTAMHQTFTKSGKNVHVLWLPSSTGATGQSVSINIPSGKRYSIYDLEYGYNNGKLRTSATSNGNVTIPGVSEKPLFVVVE